MKRKLTNDENIKNLKKREYLRIAIMIFSFATIVLSIANLFYDLSLIFALVTFFITVILNKVRGNTPINLNEDNEIKSIRNEIKKNKKKFGKK